MGCLGWFVLLANVGWVSGQTGVPAWALLTALVVGMFGLEWWSNQS